MINNLLASGCSFTFGNELSDDNGKTPSEFSWSALLGKKFNLSYTCLAKGGLGNSGISRKILKNIDTIKNTIVVVMWTFPSRYDWAMPRSKYLEDTRWATITPWDTTYNEKEVLEKIANNDHVIKDFKDRRKEYREAGVTDFADALYRYAANNYFEIYNSWKEIVFLQNILEKNKIPFFFTLADNTLFFDKFTPLQENDRLLSNLYQQINFDRWFFFGERMMGFDQWAHLNDYERATTHPLDLAHHDAVQLMENKFKQIIEGA